jgi:hypothetical protein
VRVLATVRVVVLTTSYPRHEDDHAGQRATASTVVVAYEEALG